MAAVAVVGVVLMGVGLVLSWRRNGSHQAARDMIHAEAQAARDAVAVSNQNAILARLDNKDSGLQAVNAKVSGLVTHCAVLDERVTTHDRDITDLKRRT
jgi:hypothetical protein